MFKDLGEITLKTGEVVQAGVAVAPDQEWAERVTGLLSHKGDLWNWQNSQVLKADCGIEARYYLAHRSGRPLANVMTAELAGVGILGHVYTVPEHRRKGAMGQLLRIQMADFRARGGRALFLGTGFDSPPYHMYESCGFRGIEPKSGQMDYYSASKDGFEAEYFAPDDADVVPVGWRHWPASPALFVGAFPGVVRCAPLRLFGRTSTEGALLSLLRDQERRRQEGQGPRAMALQSRGSTAVIGLAVWDWHPLWPDACLLDVYCHPNFWDRAGEMLDALKMPEEADRWLAFADTTCGDKMRVLRAAGFRRRATLKNWLAADRAKTACVDAVVFEKLP
jgi:GNAT superfamily N-acetyltransferase